MADVRFILLSLYEYLNCWGGPSDKDRPEVEGRGLAQVPKMSVGPVGRGQRPRPVKALISNVV